MPVNSNLELTLNSKPVGDRTQSQSETSRCPPPSWPTIVSQSSFNVLTSQSALAFPAEHLWGRRLVETRAFKAKHGAHKEPCASALQTLICRGTAWHLGGGAVTGRWNAISHADCPRFVIWKARECQEC